MPTISDKLNKSNTSTYAYKPVSFDIMGMFSSIDNISGLKVAKNVPDAGKDQFPTINNKHNNKHFLQSYSVAQDPHM